MHTLVEDVSKGARKVTDRENDVLHCLTLHRKCSKYGRAGLSDGPMLQQTDSSQNELQTHACKPGE